MRDRQTEPERDQRRGVRTRERQPTGAARCRCGGRAAARIVCIALPADHCARARLDGPSDGAGVPGRRRSPGRVGGRSPGARGVFHRRFPVWRLGRRP